jgi:phospholipid/cholesterol/gamma-HCH transport system permease protein
MARSLNIQRIGEIAIDSAVSLPGPCRLLSDSLRHIANLKIVPTRMVFYKQIYFTGIQALKIISVIAALIGIVIITQVASLAGLNSALIGKILIWTVVRELGPLLTVIIVIARSCTAMSSELGTMKIGGEIDSLGLMGISPLHYLVVPRVAGTTVSLLVLTLYFQIIAVTGGVVATSMLMDASFLQQMRAIFSELSPFEIAIPALKSVVFGLAVSSISCYHGLRVKSSITEIPQVTTVAVMQSLFSVFLLDGAITVATYL